MASTRERFRKDGTRYYEIRVHPANGKEVTRRWDVPDSWSDKAVQRQLAKEAAELER